MAYRIQASSPQLSLLIGFFLFPLVFHLDVGVLAKHGDVRLYHGAHSWEGTVFVSLRGRWGTVCDDNWTLREASVVCRQLGYAAALAAYPGDRFQSDDGSSGATIYLMDDVRCTGRETHLVNCTFWKDHDCRRGQQASVRCSSSFHYNTDSAGAKHSNKTKVAINPLQLNASQALLQKWSENSFSIRTQSLFIPSSGNNKPSQLEVQLLFVSVNNREGVVCPDHFGIPEAHVVCRMLGRGYAAAVNKVPAIKGLKVVLHSGRCYGNETSLRNCAAAYAHPDGVECQNTKSVVALQCTQELADILTRMTDVQRSVHLSMVPLSRVFCALEEKCFPEDVYHAVSALAQHSDFDRLSRKLLRFSSIVENVGSADFKPVADNADWQWHACHAHFHSVEEFASYEVVDMSRHVVASGHKASFCLEDNICRRGQRPKFVCSTLKNDKGDQQGISPGCMDTYYHDYDCQWVDVTDVPPGKYKFQIVTNPHFHISESSYFNNGLECDLQLDEGRATLRRCRLKHPFDLFHPPGL